MASNANAPCSNDNLETYSLLWLDAEVNSSKENVSAQKKLRSALNHIRTFEDVEECKEYIEQSTDDRITFIVSGDMGQKIVPLVHALIQIVSIYVYCFNKKKHELWTAKFPKVYKLLFYTECDK